MPHEYSMELNKCISNEPGEDIKWENVWKKSRLSLAEVYDIFKTYAEQHPDMNDGHIIDNWDKQYHEIGWMSFIENGVEYDLHVI